MVGKLSFRSALMLGTALMPAYAGNPPLPTGGRFTAGSGQIATGRAGVVIGQSGTRGIIDWNTFSVGAGHHVQFNNGSGATLNIVTGNAASAIAGTVGATGSLYIVNPQGVVVTPGGKIVTGGGFVASTRPANQAAFMANGSLQLNGTSQAGVTNFGAIQSGGDTVLVGRDVTNAGTINAGGNATLAAGDDVLLQPQGDGMRVKVKTGSGDVTNKGGIDAANIALKAAGGDVYALAGSKGGYIHATGTATKNGRVLLTASGTTEVSGTLTASGGTIAVTGQAVALDKTAKLDASGPRGGGTILVGGAGNIGPKKSKLALAQTATVAAGATLNASGGTGQGGTVVVWSQQQTDFNGSIAARGATGGSAEVSGHGLLSYQGTADLRGAGGTAGTLLLDPADVYITSAGTAPAGASIVDPSTIVSQLATSNLTVTTNGGAGNGDIFVNSPVSFGTAYTLTLSAYRNVGVNAAITATGAGNVVLTADNTGTGKGTVGFGGGGLVSLNGGSAALYYNPTAYTTPTDYSGNVSGGSLTAYMLVNSGTQLAAVSTNTGGSYALGTDVDLSSSAFTGIPSFSGVLNGQGHTISNLSINNPGGNYVGLIGQLSGSVTDLALTGVNLSGGSYVGGIAGYTSPTGSISNVTVSGSVTGQYYVGGIAGWSYGTIANAVANASVSGVSYTGGLAGRTDNTVTNASATGPVTGTSDYTGGLIGYANGSVAIGSAAGAVTGQNYAGGLVGLANAGTISASAATGTVSGASDVGGLVGQNNATIITSSVGPGTAAVTGTNDGIGGFVGWDHGTIGPNQFSARNVTGGGSYTGGFIGVEQGNSLDSVYATGTVAGNNVAGGLIGYDDKQVTNAYATGAVSGNSTVGGLIGQDNASLGNVYASGAVRGNGNSVGGLIGQTTSGATLTGAVYATGNVSNYGYYTGGLIGLSQGGAITGTASANIYATGNVAGQSYTGGLLGYNDVPVTYAYATGNVGDINCCSDFKGGLIGQNNNTLNNVFASGAVGGGSRVGGLAGHNQAQISTAYATGAVTGQYDNVGGLVGENHSNLSGAYATGNVSGRSSVGGLAGYSAGSISSAYATGTVTSGNANGTADYAGGLVGYSDSTIVGSYATGAVTGRDEVGGLVGRVNSGSVTNAYSSGAVAGTTNVGGLAGYLIPGASLVNAHYDIDAVTINGANQLTAGGMYNAQYNVWFNNSLALNPAGYFTANSNGDYLISNLQNLKDLQGFAESASLSWKLVNNIDLTSMPGQVFPYFSGTFDGQGYTITNLSLNQPSSNLGLFGAAYNATIKNLTVTGTVKGLDYAGGLVGSLVSNNFGTPSIANVNSSVAVETDQTGNTATGSGQYAGGVAGYVVGDISSATASGSVSGLNFIGGLAGYVNGGVTNGSASGAVSGSTYTGGLIGFGAGGGTISSSGASGNVTGVTQTGGLVGQSNNPISGSSSSGTVTGSSDHTGGLVGYSNGTVTTSSSSGIVIGNNYTGGLVGTNAGTIGSSFATGAVSGSTYAGGLVGYNPGAISTAYATGNVSGGGSAVGGLVGYNPGTIATAYATGGVSGNATSVGGLVGLNQNSVTGSYATGAVSGANRVGGLIGEIGAGASLTNGYSTGNVSGSLNAGGLVGYLDTGGTVSNAHYNKDAVTINGGPASTIGAVSGAQYADWIANNLALNLANYGFTPDANGVYTIATVQGLINFQGFAQTAGVAWQLGANIDLASAPGLFTPYFAGASFNGNGYAISNLALNQPSSALGLFGAVNNASLSNIAVGGTVASATSADYVGGLVGQFYTTAGNTIAGAVSSVTVSGGNQVGGLAGYTNGAVTGSSASGAVTGVSQTGGLAGHTDATITNTSATGTVTGTGDDTGGLVGYANASITAGSASGAVTGQNYTGGLAGQATSGTISDSTATGGVTGSSRVGGLVGQNQATIVTSGVGTVTTAVTGTSDGVGGFVGWDYGTIGANQLSTRNVSGSGSYTGGFVGVEQGNGLTGVQSAGNVAGNYTVGGLVGYNDRTISGSTATGAVSGGSRVGGLVGQNNATITASSVGTGSAAVSGTSDAVGGFVGWDYGTITANQFAARNVTGNGNYTGGFVGVEQGAGLNTVYATGNVTGNGTVGGLAGYDDRNMTNSYATGAVSGYNTVGGFVGQHNGGTITLSYATGAVTGVNQTGGFAGTAAGSGITSSYATGAVTGTSSETGGFAGNNQETINLSYATGTVTGVNLVGGFVGHNYGQVTNSFATGAVTGTSSGIGGFAGLSENGNVNADYASGAVTGPASGTNNYVGGFAGWLLNASVTNVYAMGSVAGNDQVGGLVGYLQNSNITSAYATGFVRASTNTGGVIGGMDNTAPARSNDILINAYYNAATSGQPIGTQTDGSAGIATTAGLQASLPAGFDPGTWATGPGLYPYLSGIYTSAPQAVTGVAYASATTPAAGARVGTYSGGALVGLGAASAGADGTFYQLAPGATVGFYQATPASQVTATSMIGEVLTLAGAGAVSAQIYADNQVLSAGNLVMPAITLGMNMLTTSRTTLSALNSDLAGTYGPAADATISAALDATPVTLRATAAAGFTIDAGLGNSGGIALTTSGPLSVNGSVNAGSGSVSLTATGAISEGASGAITAGMLNLVTTNGSATLNATANAVTGLGTVTLGSGTFGLVNSSGLTIAGPVSAAAVQLQTAGDLTIAAGGSVNATGSGTSSVLAADGSFTNNAGPGAVTSGNGSWLIYSQAQGSDGAAPAGFSPDGLAGSNYFNDAFNFGTGTFAARPGGGNHFVFGFEPTLTITPTTQTITYDGLAHTDSFSVAGLIYGDTQAMALGGVITGLTTAGNAGAYVLTASGLTSGLNYAIAYAPGTLTIDPKPLTWSVADASGTYGTLAAPGAATLGGVVAGDAVNAAVAVSRNGTPLSLLFNAAAGTYQESVAALTGSAASNYVLSAAGNSVGTLTINPKALNWSVADVSGTYGTLAVPGAATLSGVVEGDTIAGTVAISQGGSPVALSYKSAAGAYQESVVGLGGAGASNYVLAPSGNSGGTLTINPMMLTWSVASAFSTYGTRAVPGAATLNGVIAGDTVAGNVAVSQGGNPVALAYNAPVGSYQQSVFALSGNAAPNYVLAPSGNTAGPLTISPLALTWTVANTSSNYGTLATPGTASLTGVVAGDTIGTAVTVSQGGSPVALAYNSAAGTYQETVTGLTGAAASNYALAVTGNTAGTLTINRKLLTWIVADASGTYGTQPVLGAATLAGVVTGDAISGTVAVSQGRNAVALTYNTAAGTYQERVTGVTGAAAANYALAASGNLTGTLTINRKLLTWIVADASGTYGTQPVPGAATLAGVVTGDAISGTVAVSQGGAAVTLTYNTAAGTYQETVTGVTGAAAANYALAASGNLTGTLTITRKLVTWLVADSSSIYGTQATPGAAALTGVVAGDAISGTVAVSRNGSPVSLVYNSTAGTYQENVSSLAGSSAANYALADSGNTTGTLTISRKELTWAVANSASAFGAEPSVGAATLKGLIAGDAVTAAASVFAGNARITLSPSTAAGSYQEKATALSGAAASNYVLASTGNSVGSLTIAPRPIVISPPPPPTSPAPAASPQAGAPSVSSAAPSGTDPSPAVAVAVALAAPDATTAPAAAPDAPPVAVAAARAAPESSAAAPSSPASSAPVSTARAIAPTVAKPAADAAPPAPGPIASNAAPQPTTLASLTSPSAETTSAPSASMAPASAADDAGAAASEGTLDQLSSPAAVNDAVATGVATQAEAQAAYNAAVNQSLATGGSPARAAAAARQAMTQLGSAGSRSGPATPSQHLGDNLAGGKSVAGGASLGAALAHGLSPAAALARAAARDARLATMLAAAHVQLSAANEAAAGLASGNIADRPGAAALIAALSSGRDPAAALALAQAAAATRAAMQQASVVALTQNARDAAGLATGDASKLSSAAMAALARGMTAEGAAAAAAGAEREKSEEQARSRTQIGDTSAASLADRIVPKGKTLVVHHGVPTLVPDTTAAQLTAAFVAVAPGDPGGALAAGLLPSGLEPTLDLSMAVAKRLRHGESLADAMVHATSTRPEPNAPDPENLDLSLATGQVDHATLTRLAAGTELKTFTKRLGMALQRGLKPSDAILKARSTASDPRAYKVSTTQ